ncbi:hypothetical protein ACWV95_20190 [Streptomyces albus]
MAGEALVELASRPDRQPVRARVLGEVPASSWERVRVVEALPFDAGHTDEQAARDAASDPRNAAGPGRVRAVYDVLESQAPRVPGGMVRYAEHTELRVVFVQVIEPAAGSDRRPYVHMIVEELDPYLPLPGALEPPQPDDGGPAQGSSGPVQKDASGVGKKSSGGTKSALGKWKLPFGKKKGGSGQRKSGMSEAAGAGRGVTLSAAGPGGTAAELGRDGSGRGLWTDTDPWTELSGPAPASTPDPASGEVPVRYPAFYRPAPDSTVHGSPSAHDDYVLAQRRYERALAEAVLPELNLGLAVRDFAERLWDRLARDRSVPREKAAEAFVEDGRLEVFRAALEKWERRPTSLKLLVSMVASAAYGNPDASSTLDGLWRERPELNTTGVPTGIPETEPYTAQERARLESLGHLLSEGPAAEVRRLLQVARALGFGHGDLVLIRQALVAVGVAQGDHTLVDGLVASQQVVRDENEPDPYAVDAAGLHGWVEGAFAPRRALRLPHEETYWRQVTRRGLVPAGAVETVRRLTGAASGAHHWTLGDGERRAAWQEWVLAHRKPSLVRANLKPGHLAALYLAPGNRVLFADGDDPAALDRPGAHPGRGTEGVRHRPAPLPVAAGGRPGVPRRGRAGPAPAAPRCLRRRDRPAAGRTSGRHWAVARRPRMAGGRRGARRDHGGGADAAARPRTARPPGRDGVREGRPRGGRRCRTRRVLRAVGRPGECLGRSVRRGPSRGHGGERGAAA